MKSKYFPKKLVECEWVTVTSYEISRLKYFCLVYYTEGRIQVQNQRASKCTLAAYHKHIRSKHLCNVKKNPVLNA
jgi:hypothetical protein